jgi:cytochrome b
MNNSSTPLVKVWDPIVRIGHWTLVATFAIAYFLDDDFLRLHVWSGYLLGIVVLFRVIWGFVGPQRARFTDFVYRPGTVVTYGLDLLRFRGRRYIGHSPAGGAMILVTLVMLGAVVYSGLMVYALEENRGPLAVIVAQVPAQAMTAAADDNGEDSEDDEARAEFWEELHEVLSNATMILIILHIGGVALASYAHRENLVRAMFTGKKRPDAET